LFSSAIVRNRDVSCGCTRLFPVGVDVSRILQKNIVIGGYQIPAGASITAFFLSYRFFSFDNVFQNFVFMLLIPSFIDSQ